MLISPAFAQAAGAPAAGFDPMQFLPMVVVFVAFYFMLIRPQQKRAKEHKTMLDALQKNDEVVAGGGLVGRVVKVSENFITLEIASGIEVQVQRQAVQTVLPKGTLKNG